MSTVGQRVGHVDSTRRDRERRAHGARPTRCTSSLTGVPTRVQGEHAGFDAGHVEEIRDQPREAIRLDLDQPVELAGVTSGELARAVGQRRRGDLDGGEWRAQVVGDRAEQSPAEPVRFFEQFGAQRLLAQLGPLEREGGVIREGVEHGPGRSRRSGHRASRGSRPLDPDAESAMVRSCAGDVRRRADADGLARVGSSWRSSSAVSGSPALATTTRRPSSSSSSETPGTSKTVWAVVDDVSRAVRRRAGHRPAAPRLPRLGARRHGRRLRLDPRGVQHVDDARDQQHHDDVDDERRPVLRRPDAQRPVGRNEDVVVDEEAGDHARGAGARSRR